MPAKKQGKTQQEWDKIRTSYDAEINRLRSDEAKANTKKDSVIKHINSNHSRSKVPDSDIDTMFEHKRTAEAKRDTIRQRSAQLDSTIASSKKKKSK